MSAGDDARTVPALLSRLEHDLSPLRPIRRRMHPATPRLPASDPRGDATWQQQFTVDAMAAALLISEFARRHIARGADWGRIIGLTSGGDLGFPEEVS